MRRFFFLTLNLTVAAALCGDNLASAAQPGVRDNQTPKPINPKKTTPNTTPTPAPTPAPAPSDPVGNFIKKHPNAAAAIARNLMQPVDPTPYPIWQPTPVWGSPVWNRPTPWGWQPPVFPMGMGGVPVGVYSPYGFNGFNAPNFTVPYGYNFNNPYAQTTPFGGFGAAPRNPLPGLVGSTFE